jgi:potassium intermediate/small conductance calcium-activated channel subfamily N protein 2
MAIKLSERPFYENWLEEGDPRKIFQDYSYVWNGMWLAFVTMSTVGYGDFYARTHLGRFFSSIAAFWGVFLVSLIV